MRKVLTALAIAGLTTHPVRAQDAASGTGTQTSEPDLDKQKAEEEVRKLRLENEEKERALAEAKRNDLKEAFPAGDTTGKVDVKASAGLAEAQTLSARALSGMAKTIAASIADASGRSGSQVGSPAPSLPCSLGAFRQNAAGPVPAANPIPPPMPMPNAGGAQTPAPVPAVAPAAPVPVAVVPVKPVPVLLLTGSQPLSFGHYELFKFRACALAKTFDEATAAANEALSKVQNDGGPRPAGSLPGIGAAASLATQLAKLVTPDWEVGGMEVKPSDRALAMAVAEEYLALPGEERAIHWQQATSKLGGSDHVFAALRELDSKDVEAKELAGDTKGQVAKAQKAYNAIAKQPNAETSPEKKELDRWTGLQAQLTSASAGYSQLLTHLNGKPGEALLPISSVIDQAATVQVLGSNGIAASVAVESAAGGYYTRRVLWNVFDIGGPPFFATGGTVASFAVVRPSDQRMLTAGLVACHAGYTKVSRVAQRVNSGTPVCSPVTSR